MERKNRIAPYLRGTAKQMGHPGNNEFVHPVLLHSSSNIVPRYSFSVIEVSRILAKWIYYSEACQATYLSMITFTLLGMAWTLIHWDDHANHAVFWVLEVMINATLIIEVTIRMIALRSHFWSYWTNVFDMLVLCLSVIAIIFFYIRGSPGDRFEDYADISLLVIRYTIQLLRIFLFIKNHQSSRTADVHVVDFSMLQEEGGAGDGDTALDMHHADIALGHAHAHGPVTTISIGVDPADKLIGQAGIGGDSARSGGNSSPSPQLRIKKSNLSAFDSEPDIKLPPSLVMPR